MIKNKHVKIVATLGPASDSYEMILGLAKAGVDIFRMNLSHATEEEISNRFIGVRKAEKELSRPLSIMGDLAGLKIRIGEITPHTVLEKGKKVTIIKEKITGNAERFSLNFPSIVEYVESDSIIYIDDGAIKLKAGKKDKNGIQATVMVGGPLTSRKGFISEGLALGKVGISDKDKNSIKLMVKMGVDTIAISFVQNADDVHEVKKLLPKDSQIMLMSKIETASGVENAEEIVDASDGIIIARGDMGLSIPLAKVPHVQKTLIKLALKKAKPVITATQILESMVSRSIPTRAEVTDVANAILDGTGCLMLSAETATGMFPIETVETMVRIINESIQYVEPMHFPDDSTIGDAVSAAAGQIARQTGAKLIIAYTEKGITARKISRHRHKHTIVALSSNDATVHKLNFAWGVYSHLIGQVQGFDNILQKAREMAKNNRVLPLSKGDMYVIAAGVPYGKSGATNFIYVDKV
ncbi:MAG TPA: pyruvate kinase [Candidatus Saccharimonadales bacterium]|nr:pyruvate kinase [Candidatus Saccharimonadales bacterium]